MKRYPLLPAATHPKTDELLSSWIVRLARDHYTKVYTFGKLIFPNTDIWNRDIDKVAPEQVLTILAARTSTKPACAYATTLKWFEGRLYLKHNALGNTIWLLPLGIYHRTRRSYGQLFCPGCLQKDGLHPYYRTKWRLSLSVVCPNCRQLLHDRCPSCQQPVIFFRLELGRKSALADLPMSHCFQCGFDLAKTIPHNAPDYAVANQQEWYRILTEGWKSDVLYPHLYFAVLHQIVQLLSSRKQNCIRFRQGVDSCLDEYLPRLHDEQLGKDDSFEYQPILTRYVLLQQASWLISDWPERFINLMKKYHITSTPLLQNMQNVPFWYESIIRDNLYMNNVNRRFGNFWGIVK